MKTQKLTLSFSFLYLKKFPIPLPIFHLQTEAEKVNIDTYFGCPSVYCDCKGLKDDTL